MWRNAGRYGAPTAARATGVARCSRRLGGAATALPTARTRPGRCERRASGTEVLCDPRWFWTPIAALPAEWVLGNWTVTRLRYGCHATSGREGEEPRRGPARHHRPPDGLSGRRCRCCAQRCSSTGSLRPPLVPPKSSPGDNFNSSSSKASVPTPRPTYGTPSDDERPGAASGSYQPRWPRRPKMANPRR